MSFVELSAVLGNWGEFVGSIGVVATLAYLAVQIRQSNAQQKLEELTSVQHGQNAVVAQLRDPRVMGGYVRAAAGQNPSIEDRGVAFSWVVQYLNQFEVVHRLYRNGSMEEERYQTWADVAVSIIAPSGIRHWWDEENGRSGFLPEVRELIDHRLKDKDRPPLPITEMWSVFYPEAWESAATAHWSPNV